MIDYINYVILIYVLGIIGIVINVYAFFKRDNEYTARLLGPNQTLTTIDTYLESGDGVEMMTDFINQYKINFRYIELMQTGDNLNYFKKYHQGAKIFKEYLETNGWLNIDRTRDDGPALNYINQKSNGKFGVIAPYSKDFCKTCNRLRITAKGELRLCLFGNTGTDLRKYLQNARQKEELLNLILTQLRFKKESHYLELGNTGITPHLASIGG